MPYKSPHWRSLFWFFGACYTKETEAFTLSSCFSSIYLRIPMVQIIITSKHSFCFSILTVQKEVKDFLSLSSILLKNSPFFFYDYCLRSVHVLKQIWVCTGDICDPLGAYVIECLEDIVQTKCTDDREMENGSSFPSPLNRSNQTSPNLLSYVEAGESTEQPKCHCSSC